MLTIREAAERIGTTPASVRVWIWQGRFPGAKKEETPMGEYWVIPEEEINSFEKGKAGRPPKPKDESKKGKAK